MKLSFTPLDDGMLHTYCLRCKQEGLEYDASGTRMYTCRACGHDNPRALIVDPAIKWWLGEDGEYWHESAGVFIENPAGEFLFFERILYPSGLTVPAGHVDKNEAPAATAVREVREEVGLEVSNLVPIASDDIFGDACRRGSDAHRWHSFATYVPAAVTVEVNDEGVRPVWLTLRQAIDRELTFATRHVIARHADALRHARP